MEWFGASVIAPESDAPIEFELTSESNARTGRFHGAMFFVDGEPTGYPRRLVRRWRYLAAPGESGF